MEAGHLFGLQEAQDTGEVIQGRVCERGVEHHWGTTYALHPFRDPTGAAGSYHMNQQLPSPTDGRLPLSPTGH